MGWSRLEQFREFGDDALTMTREIVSLFVCDAPARLAALQAALASNNSAAISQTAHALKASASNIGASAIGDACGQLEYRARKAHARQMLPAESTSCASCSRLRWHICRIGCVKAAEKGG